MAALSAPGSFAGYVRLLKANRNVRLLWSAQIVSELGDWMYTAAVFSCLLDYTGSARAIGLAFVLQVLPQFFVSPAAGVLADRLSRKRLMIFADWTRAAIVLCMMLADSPKLVPILYVLLVMESLMWSLFEPARSAVIPNIATPSELITANSLSTMTWSVNFFVGFAVGGLLMACFGHTAVFVVNSLSFVCSAMLIKSMRFKEAHLEAARPLAPHDLFDFSPIREGVDYVRRDRWLLATLFVKCGMGLIGAYWVLLPVLGERVFPVHSPGLAINASGLLGMTVLMAARGAGAFVGPAIGARWAGNSKTRMRLLILYGFLIVALGYLALASAPSLSLACMAVLIAHSGGSMVWVASSTLLQLQAGDQFRGRIFSAEFAFAVVTLSLSSYIAGALIDAGVSPQMACRIYGVAFLVPALLWAFLLKRWNTDSASQSPAE